MNQYESLLQYVLDNGVKKDDRTGTGTISTFGNQLRFDLQKGFPLITTKRLHFKFIVFELLWFLRGDSNIRFLHENGVSIWDEWNTPDGELGPIYGYQWRSWPSQTGEHIDQLFAVIESIRTTPNSRRLLVSSWNVADLPKMALPPCHVLFQFYIAEGKLSGMMFQRSADMFLSVPFNIASYALLTLMVAHVTGYEPGEFIHSLADTHIYMNHIEQVKLQLSRVPKPLPNVSLNPQIKSIFDFRYEDIKLIGYDPYPSIKAPIAV